MIRARFFLSLLLLVALAPLVLAGDKKDGAKFEMTKDEKTLMDLVNKERAEKDLPALRPHPLLFKAARDHAANMAKQRKMEHELDGKKPPQRVQAAGYNWGKVSENLAVSDNGTPPLTEVVKKWVESETHRNNLLGKDVAETGLGLARNDQGETYYVQVFARQRKVIQRRD